MVLILTLARHPVQEFRLWPRKEQGALLWLGRSEKVVRLPWKMLKKLRPSRPGALREYLVELLVGLRPLIQQR